MLLRRVLGIASLLAGAAGAMELAWSGPGATSASFSIDHHQLHGGGGRSRSARYVMDAALSDFGTARRGSLAAHVLRSGFAGQLNDPPRPGFDVIEWPVGQPLEWSVAELLANDLDLENDPFTFALPASTSARGGSVRLEAGRVFYTPPVGPALISRDAFAYRLTDATGLSAEGRVFIVFTEPARRFVEMHAGQDSLTLTWRGVPRALYKLQFRTGLDTATPWRDFPEGDPLVQPAGSDGTYRFVVPLAGGQGFFRTVRVDEASNLLELARRGNDLTLSFRGTAGGRYRLQFRASLDPAVPWTDYPDAANPWIAEAGEAGVYQFRPTLVGSEGYFRAVAVGP